MEEAGELSAHLLKVRAMTKEYASAGVLKRVAQQRHGYPMGTVRPPLVPLSASFDAAAAVELASSAQAALGTVEGGRR
jgi:4-hydroxy-tetrahydrodipicolinate synthase